MSAAYDSGRLRKCVTEYMLWSRGTEVPQQESRVGTPMTFWNKAPEFYCIESVQNTVHNGSDVLSSGGLTNSYTGVRHCCFQTNTFLDSNFINKSGKIETKNITLWRVHCKASEICQSQVATCFEVVPIHIAIHSSPQGSCSQPSAEISSCSRPCSVTIAKVIHLASTSWL